MNLRKHSGIRLSLLVAGLAFSAMAAPGPTALSGTYSSTIVDWPKGKTGTVSMTGEDPVALATGTVDADGHFTIKLPDPNVVDLKNSAVSGLFLPVSNFRKVEDGCVGQGTASPASAHYNELGLWVSIQGGDPILLKFRSDTRLPYAVGQNFSALYYFDVPTTLDGSVICAPVAVSVFYKGTFPAGWSLPSGIVSEISADQTSVQSYTPDPLPANVTWHLYNLLSGIGIQFEPVPTGQVGVKVSRVTPGLPADTAGVQLNDVVVEVDGKDLTALSLGQIGDLIRGPANTAVTLGIKRGAETTVRQIKIVRAEIKAP